MTEPRSHWKRLQVPMHFPAGLKGKLEMRVRLEEKARARLIKELADDGYKALGASFSAKWDDAWEGIASMVGELWDRT